MWDFGESKLKIADLVENSLPPPVACECENRSPCNCLVALRTEAGAMVVEQKGRKKQALLWVYLIRGPDIFIYLF